MKYVSYKIINCLAWEKMSQTIFNGLRLALIIRCGVISLSLFSVESWSRAHFSSRSCINCERVRLLCKVFSSTSQRGLRSGLCPGKACMKMLFWCFQNDFFKVWKDRNLAFGILEYLHAIMDMQYNVGKPRLFFLFILCTCRLSRLRTFYVLEELPNNQQAVL